MWKLFAMALIIVFTASAAGGGGAAKSDAGVSQRDFAQRLVCSRAATGEAGWIRQIQAAHCDWKRRVDSRRVTMAEQALASGADATESTSVGWLDRRVVHQN